MRFLPALCTLVLLASCSQQRYLQSAPPVMNPLFQEKGEAFVSAAYHSAAANEGTEGTNSTKSHSNGVAAQGGYAFSSHFGMAASMMYLGEKDDYDNGFSSPFDASTVRYNRSEFSLAGAYFFRASNNKSGVNLLFGTSVATLRMQDAGKLGGGDYRRYFNANTNTFFVQPCVNVYMREHSALGFSFRLNFGSFNNIRTDYYQTELETLGLNYRGSYFSSEFGMKFRYGIPRSPVFFDAGLNYVLNHSSGYFARKTNGSLGIAFRLGRGNDAKK